MGQSIRRQLVFTVKDKCRVCYTCLRECPAKAIRIINGQAEVIHERCIGCGNCVKVCSQDAKVYLKAVDEIRSLLASGEKIAACVAPSFPAEFTEIADYRKLVGMLKELGFRYVTEVSFGADLVAREYGKLQQQNPGHPVISSDCPAIVYFIEHYHPGLVPYLAPVASPMVASARIVRHLYGEDCKVVFIGPCVAKKAESDEVDVVLTFREIRQLFGEAGIEPGGVVPLAFDPPHGGHGAIFPISGGLLETSGLSSRLFVGDVILAEGRANIRDAIKAFEEGLLNARHLELLCCEGCITGAGMSPEGKKYARRNYLSRYVKQKLENLDQDDFERQKEIFSGLDYSQHFESKDRRIPAPGQEEIHQVLESMGKYTLTDLLNCGACGYDTCVEHAIAIVQGLAENEMCLPYAIEKLHNYIGELNVSNEKLASAQQALQQSEKLASLGQLSAGIAHELNNPLGVITMYSNILKDETPEGDPIRGDLDLIVEQADRCKKIVGGLLNFARKNKVSFSEVDLNILVEHSLSSIIVPEHIRVRVDYETSFRTARLDFDQMTQVITNLVKNAVDAMPGGGELAITLGGGREEMILQVSDTGAGIRREDMDKVFTPFYTTKGLGKGTGLGLPIIYGIVKMHKGNVTLTSNASPEEGPTGTTFRITLPRSGDPSVTQTENS